jgi:gamma-glutamylcyclotransferase (GGCT)/AIG2-like uncharacterized protein YtfP
MAADEPDLLFAYGTLGPASAGDVARGGWVADAVRGRLFDLGPYPALVDLGGAAAGWVHGHVRHADRDEVLGRLDAYEGVDEGLYRRVAAATRAGRRVWVYVYARALPPGARAVPGGRWRPIHRPGAD